MIIGIGSDLSNPTWAQGRFAVSGSVLGGAVKVNTNFQFEMGDKCYPGPSDPLKDIKIISDYGPARAEVFDEPYVVANQPLGEVMEISIPPTESKPAGEVRSYRFSIQSFHVSLNGALIKDEGIQYAQDHTIALKRHSTIFEPRKTYQVKVVCIAEQWYPEQSRWDHPYNDKTKKKEEHTELTSFSFTTGDAPLTIPDKNVVLSYPVKGQRFVLKNEMSGSGKLQLKMWQPNILSSGVLMKWELLFVNLSRGDTIRSSFVPDAANNSLHYKLPPQLQNDATYRVIFWPKPQETRVGVRIDLQARNISTRVSESTRRLGTEGEVTLTRRTATVTQSKPFEQPVYSFVFATSKYNSLTEKLIALGDWKGKNAANKLTITNTGSIPEPFDEVEVKGFTSPAGASYPSLLSVQLAWDGSRQNDVFAKDKLYTNALVLTVSGATINLGVPSVRKEIYKPVNTVDWTRMKTASLINTTSSMIVNQKQTIGIAAGISPAASSMSQLNSGPAVAVKPSFGTPVMANGHTILWTREAVMLQDYQLMKSFAQKILAFQKSYQGLERTLSLEALEDDNSPQLYTSNGIGGFAYIPLNKLGAIYRSTVNMNILKGLAALSYQYLPASGNRGMQFNYGLKGFTTTSINKTITY